ncbi:MAG: hypothetical protein KDC18_18575 [Alphaproteobacteria bacterium]|nr:hypothetical protein [Alphaproteobacteria bacterium]MCB9929078.1 hypothetical protein [Alphaproteobacteria bacterium]
MTRQAQTAGSPARQPVSAAAPIQGAATHPLQALADASPASAGLLALRGLAANAPAVQRLQALQMRADVAQMRGGARTSVPSYRPILQRNAFLTNLANPAGQIDYGVISGGGATANQVLLYNAISDAVNQNRRNQAVLAAIEASGQGANFEQYAAGQDWTLGAIVAAGQDIRSSHSGGAIDPNLPQAAYEPGGVAGGGLTVSVAPPALNTLAERANFDWLDSSTTTHTTDPDHPQFRGPTASGGAKPTLGSVVNPALGGHQRLPTAPNRVASYFELGAHAVSDGGTKLVSGTRVVFDPFAGRYFVSEHYARQYELTNVPAATAHPFYNSVWTGLTNMLASPAYTGAGPAGQATMRETAFAQILKRFNTWAAAKAGSD